MKNDTHEPNKHLQLSLVNFVFKIFEWLHYVMIYVIHRIQNIYNFLAKHYQQYLYVAMALAAATKDCMGHGDLMSVNSLWCCWALSLVLVWMLSHLGCALLSPKNRTQKRMVRRQRIQCQFQLKESLFASWAMHCHGMEAGGEQGEHAILQRMTILAEAATNAASAAERALNTMGSSSSSSSGGALQTGLSAASKILRNPDRFSGEDTHVFSPWKFSFVS